MIRFAEHLYVGETAARKKKKYIRAVRSGKFLPDLYLITYSASDRDMLDIIRSVYLRQETLRKRLPDLENGSRKLLVLPAEEMRRWSWFGKW